MANPWFEMFGVNLLLTSPSTLGRAWTDSNDRKKWQAAVDAMKLSVDGNVAAISRMELLDQAGARPHAKAFADALRDAAYSGSEPHPDDRNARTMVTLLRVFDEELERSAGPLTQAAKQLETLKASLSERQGKDVQAILDNVRAAQNPFVFELAKR